MNDPSKPVFSEGSLSSFSKPAPVLGRRRFLQQLSKFGAAATLAPAILTDAKGAESAALDVIVIGAGLAGIAAAQRLREGGRGVVVLEARNRIGGRIHTQRQWPGPPVDVGASWLHDAHDNALLPLTVKYGLQTVDTPYANSIFRQASGPRLSVTQAAELALTYGGVVAKIREYALARQQAGLPDASLQSGFDYVYANENPPFTPEQLELLSAPTNTTVLLGAGVPMSKISLYNYGLDANFVGVDDRIFPHGFDQLVAALARGTDVRLRTIVRKIEYGNRRVTVSTNRGVFHAKRVICTLPLGVLKTGQVEFSPGLPNAKLTAIQRLNFGGTTKLYLMFPRTFWDPDPTWIFRISSADQPWVNWLNIGHYLKKHIIMGFINSTFAREMEALPEAEMVQHAMDALRETFGRNIPDPVAHIRSGWIYDPFARGTFPGAGIGASAIDFENLFKPVGNSLFFAGDSTTSVFPSNAQGAYLTGRAAADLILKQGR